ncbi:ricin-type beta-trefoil lectin domain protein [Kribbella sp. NPDC000426]|uniref:RICIN domain-containing protein n=1 Tax=Kribbella sp. NPDC000426 TaxID=3154255 RepID=UPI003320AB23
MRKLLGVLSTLAVAAAGLVAATSPAQSTVYLGVYMMKALGTNLCIADSSDGLWMQTCNSHDTDQQWDTNAPPNTRVFSNRTFIGYCLDDSINGLMTVRCNGTDYQRFTLDVKSDGAYVKNVHTHGCVTFGSGNVYASACRALHSQRWVLVKL